MANSGTPPSLPHLPVLPLHFMGDPTVSGREFNIYGSSGAFNKDTQRNIDRVVENVLGGPGKPCYSGVAPISDRTILDHTNHPVLLAEAIAAALSNHKAWELPKDFPCNGEAPKPYPDRLTPVRLHVVKRLIPKTSARHGPLKREGCFRFHELMEPTSLYATMSLLPRTYLGISLPRLR